MRVSPSPPPKVSVLMPAYNAERFLDEAMESILQQTYTDFELIVVDDGSTDSTPEILRRYVEQDSRVRVLRNETNLGIVHALNWGFAKCRGEYVARMDADDVSMPNRLARQVAVLESDPSILVLGGSVSYMDSEGNLLDVVRRSQFRHSLLHSTPLLHPTVIIRKRALDGIETVYEEKYLYAEDYFLWLRLARKGKLDAVPDVVLHYRISEEVTRIRRLKGVIWATLKVKWNGVFKLGIRPRVRDVGRFLAECVLLVLPSRWVLSLYMRMTFGPNKKIVL